MSQAVKLPFKLQLNAPISGLLLNQRPPIIINKQLPFAINKLYRMKIKQYFKQIKNCNKNQSHEILFKQLVQSIKQQKKQQKPSYLHYAVQQLPIQPSIPKTQLFNLRIRAIKQSIFLLIKNHSLKQKSQQLTTILINRQSQLLNHLIPKIEEKILTYGFRKVVEYARQQKGRFMIVKVLDRLSKVMIKRVGYSEFFNKSKKLTYKQNKQKLATKKLTKIINQSTKTTTQQYIRKLQLYTQSIKLQQIIQQKKQMINQVYNKNTQRTIIIQQQRQSLRNLKYKLDQQAVQRSHVLTDKRRALMLARTRFNQDNKLLVEEKNKVDNQVMRLQKVVSKQNTIRQRLDNIRKTVTNTNINYQHTVSSIYHQLTQFQQQQQQQQDQRKNLNIVQRLVQIINKVIDEEEECGQDGQEQSQQNNSGMILTLQSVQNTRAYQYKRIQLLQNIMRYLQFYKNNNNNNINTINSSSRIISSLNTSTYNYPNTQPQTPKQLTSSQYTSRTLSQSRLVNNNYINNNSSSPNITTTLNNGNNNTSSRVSMNENGNIKSNNGMNRQQSNLSSTTSAQLYYPLNNQPIQYTKCRQQLTLIQQILKLTIKKRYQLQIKHAITQQLQQLSQLLVNDMKQNHYQFKQQQGEKYGDQCVVGQRLEGQRKKKEQERQMKLVNGNSYSNGRKR